MTIAKIRGKSDKPKEPTPDDEEKTRLEEEKKQKLEE